MINYSAKVSPRSNYHKPVPTAKTSTQTATKVILLSSNTGNATNTGNANLTANSHFFNATESTQLTTNASPVNKKNGANSKATQVIDNKSVNDFSNYYKN